MTLNQKISRALLVLAPGAEWTLTGNDYSQINWLSSDIIKPSWQKVEAEINNPTQIEVSIVEKLASVGLSIDDLKAALGL